MYNENTIVVGLARVGADDQVIKVGTMKELLEYDFGKPLHSFIIPGNMHFLEADCLKEYAVSKESFEKYAKVSLH